MPFDFAAFCARAVHRLHRIEKAVAPVHEGLRVDVLVILDEIETALERLVHDAAVILAREAELGFRSRAQERPAEFVQALALDDDAGGRPLKGLHVRDR